jgi:uncharacterized phage infection (PIP) family protein YhgE
MAEIEFAGVKFKGGKMVAVAMALSTLIGGLYGAFEVYKDYTTMKQKITTYVAPDLSGFDKRIELLKQKVEESYVLVGEAQETARDMRTDLKNDMNQLSDTIYELEKKNTATEREIRELMRSTEKDMREMINSADDRMDTTRRKVESDIRELEDRVNKTIEKALNNPLNKL